MRTRGWSALAFVLGCARTEPAAPTAHEAPTDRAARTGAEDGPPATAPVEVAPPSAPAEAGQEPLAGSEIPAPQLAPQLGSCGKPDLALTIVVDRSGSMTGQPLAMTKEGVASVARTLCVEDFFGVVAFDSSPTRVVKLGRRGGSTALFSSIASIQPGGGTEVLSALRVAFEDMSPVTTGKRHVLLVTDGLFPTSGILELIDQMQQAGITVSTVGLGDSFDDKTLKQMAQRGHGRFFAVGAPSTLPGTFVKDAMSARK